MKINVIDICLDITKIFDSNNTRNSLFRIAEYCEKYAERYAESIIPNERKEEDYTDPQRAAAYNECIYDMNVKLRSFSKNKKG